MSISKRSSSLLSENLLEAEELQEEIKHISRIDALCFSVIIEECLERLEVLKRIMAKDGLDAEESKPVFALGNSHHRSHLGKNVLKPSFFPLFMRTLEERETYLESNAMLQDNGKRIESLFKSIQDEILQNGTYVILTEAIPIEHQQNILLAETQQVENELKHVAETLAKGVKDLKEETKRCLEETEKEILKENEKLHTSVTRALIEFQYMKNKMQSPMAQRSALLKRSKEKELETASKLMDREHKVHNELMSYLEYAIDSLHDDIQNWMDTWEQDTGEKNREITRLNSQKEDIEINIDDLIALEEEHRKVIQETSSIRDKETNEQRKLMRENLAAKKIQKWWRKHISRRRRRRRKKKGKGKSPKGRKKRY